MRRLDQRDGSIIEQTERGPQKPHFADTRLLHHQIDEFTEWPPATGQFGGQDRITRVDRLPTPVRKLRRSPERRMNLFGRDSDGGHWS